MVEGLAYYISKRIIPLVRRRVGHLCAEQNHKRGGLGGPGEEGAMAAAAVNTPPPIHPILEQSVSFLLGTWRGEGEGGFPTIQSFKYGEEIKLWHVGKPMMAYTQRTWKAASGEPMHAESGFFRPKPDGMIEVVIAQSTGLAEVQKGSYDSEQKTLELRTTVVGNASKVVEITRKFKVEGDELRYSVDMATHSHDLQPHLKATLRRVS